MAILRPTPSGETPLWENLSELLAAGDKDAVAALAADLPPGEVARILARLDNDERVALLSVLPPRTAAELVEQVPDAQCADILAMLDREKAAAIVDALPSNSQADLLTVLPREDAEALLDAMDPAEAADAKRLVQYPENSAGGVMISELLAYPEDVTVDAVLADLRANTERYQRHDVQYIYITDRDGGLSGVLRLRDLLLTDGSEPVCQIMISDAASVHAGAPLPLLRDFFATHPYRGVPVVDDRHRLVGVVRHADVAEALEERGASDHLKTQGIVGGEELRTMPVLTRAWHRLSWLSINVVLNILAASVIALYQETLSAAIVLAVFLPIISDMSGCSGNQAIAVSMRELTLGIIRPADAWSVWKKEVSVGLINALALGGILGLAAYAWKGNMTLSLVVSSALAVNTVVAVSLGSLVPLLLRRMHRDPALASGPILTTVTDMCGFFLVLSIASSVIPALG